MIYPLVIWHSHWKWPIYRWFTYEKKWWFSIVIFNDHRVNHRWWQTPWVRRSAIPQEIRSCRRYMSRNVLKNCRFDMVEMTRFSVRNQQPLPWKHGLVGKLHRMEHVEVSMSDGWCVKYRKIMESMCEGCVPIAMENLNIPMFHRFWCLNISGISLVSLGDLR